MHDTTDTTQDIEAGDATPNGLIVTAEVTLRDRSNVSVSKLNLDAALAVIRRRHHSRAPVIELAPVHANDTVCFTAGRWKVVDTGLDLLPGDDPEPTSYQVEYHNFSIITPGEGSIAAKSSLWVVVAAAQSLANRHVDSFELTSALPGFRTLVLEPESFDDTGDFATVSQLPPKPTAKPTTPSKLSRVAGRLRTRWNTLKPAPKQQRTPQQGKNKPLTNLPWAKKAPVLISAAAVVLVGLLILGLGLVQPFAGSRSTESAAAPTWFTPAPVAEPAAVDLLDGFDTKLWELPTEKTAALGWFKAGVAYVTPDSGELVLTDTATGDELGKADVDGPIKYTAEFMTGETPAVAARTDKSVTIVTGDGTTQSWPVGEDQSLNVSGTTPMVTDKDGGIQALIVGEKKPLKVSANPQFLPVAVDDHILVQVESGKPRLVTVPFGDTKAEATTITLSAPTEDATFVRHISAGHGLAIAEWSVDGTNYAVVHNLDDGTITGAAETSNGSQDWKVGRGLETAIIGNAAFNLTDGTLTAQSTTGNFATALGPAAITEHGSERTYYLNKHTYTDPDRVIGYTSEDIALVRQSNGVVTANEKGSTQ